MITKKEAINVDKREDLIKVLEGGTPSKTPYTVLDWNMERAVTSDDLADRINDDKWRRLLDMGLTIRHHCSPVKAIEHGVEYKSERKNDGTGRYDIEIKTTPMGSIRRVSHNGRCCEEWIKTPADYKIQRWIIENTELIADYEAVEKAEQVVGSHGIVALTGHGKWVHRTPLMTLNLDYLGTEQFCLDVAMEEPELFDLLAMQEKLFLAEQRLIAAAPGRYVIWYENLMVNMIGPKRYADLMMPVYNKAGAIYDAANKRMMVHYDGTTDLIADQIAMAPFQIMDSLTEPPEGDMTYDRCRAMWPDKVFLANINVGLYSESEQVLRQAIIDKANRAGTKALAFEIAEDTPANWEQAIPIVLQTLDRL